MKKRILIFASGSGTNAENLIRHFHHSTLAEVVGIFCNVPNAGVIARAERLHVPVYLFDRNALKTAEGMDNALLDFKPDIIVLAGFLWLIPSWLVRLYPNRIVNIHPALLPAYGGKGMYGHKVHEAVIANKESKHGVTVHLVNEEYDKGQILMQESFEITPNDTVETVALKIHDIEYRIFPKVVEDLLKTIP
jgi:phosphoribosylglycinamide formyltransferase 1